MDNKWLGKIPSKITNAVGVKHCHLNGIAVNSYLKSIKPINESNQFIWNVKKNCATINLVECMRKSSKIRDTLSAMINRRRTVPPEEILSITWQKHMYSRSTRIVYPSDVSETFWTNALFSVKWRICWEIEVMVFKLIQLFQYGLSMRDFN